MSHHSRRDVLRAAPLAAALPYWMSRAAAQPATDGGLIVRMQEPLNLEMPFHALSSWKVPTERFYVRSHFAVPKIDVKSYSLRIEGHVEKPYSIALDELKKLPQTTRPLTLECAGNGRVFLVPQVRGLQWGLGAVGNAEWTGVPLSALLERAQPKAGAVDVVLVGADSGTVAEPPSPGAVAFDRSVPLAKALKPEAMIAHGMNGEALTPSHGFPVRAVIGGWYGMASVKWLTRIVVTDRPHTGFWQTLEYSTFERNDGVPALQPLGAMQPKAAIARPVSGEAVALGQPYRIFGAAWAGEHAVAQVDVSTDGGKSWTAAALGTENQPFAWRFWSHTWTPNAAGPAKLLARCTDAGGTMQPLVRDPGRRTYAINHLIPTEVLVR